ncbi:hypothetical protein SAMN05216330_102841 [Bradyrhizobium sp. Ghvi]|uniref:hypothetical protein n=1 Tax=Bradyrhizobium sp. Ghvi TaxID=1855319 RepID=UPI0008F418FA|nr:hypothetical protein [Bradyrhizobium sp. Ghvi]SFO35913.1 hypothetical protein SAMN05216330_102841 [Bradyrhizobium sp. Ghvi]
MSVTSDEQATRSDHSQPAGGDARLDALVHRLPPRLAGTVDYLMQPSSRWVRIPTGMLLVVGGVLSFLPVLGIWMLPLGLALLAEDVPALRTSRSKVFDWIQRRKPHWLDPSVSKK